jgi:hypothetical protein
MDTPENSNSVTAVQSPDRAVPITSMWTPGKTSVPWNRYHAFDGEAKKEMSLRTYRELLCNTLDSYLTQVSNRLGSITRTLSIVATVSIPFVVISGLWGMNLERTPLHGWPHGFWFMIVAQLVSGGLLLAVVRWRKLL